MSNATFAPESFVRAIEARQRMYLVRLHRQHVDIQFDTLGGPVIAPPKVAHPKLDSHLLTLAALPWAGGSVLDAFCGCGVVGLGLREKCEHCLFLDISEPAIAASKLNVERLGMKNARFLHGTIEQVEAGTSFDLITANPPYSDLVQTSLLDGICFDPDHLSVRNFIACAAKLLRPEGCILITWANFADFAVLERILGENRLFYVVSGSVQEPISDREKNVLIEYRVYRCWNA
jgi:methylase of polypeptide subunit release factors